MENIKFRVWDNVDYMSKPFTLLDVQRRLTQFAHDCSVMKFTGLTDKNGVDIYEGDILNIYYTSNLYGDTYNHDGIYITAIGALGDIVFRFKKLLWDNYGHNQYPFNSTLSQEFNSLSYRYSEELHKNELRAIDDSTYFEVIGNIHQNPELLDGNK